jgi:hypothetical protein
MNLVRHHHLIRLLAFFLVACFAVAADAIERFGPPMSARMGHTATLLPDGRVLMDGGAIGKPYPHICEECMLEAELFDPASGKAIRVGGVRPSRKYHSATLLADGRVLIAGGLFGGKSSRSAEIFDPVRNEFVVTGDMVFPHARHSSHLLSDGRTLIVGGEAPTEIFDPQTGKFERVGGDDWPRTFPQSVLLDGDRVLYSGGFPPSAGIMSPDGRSQNLNVPTRGSGFEEHTATRLPNGDVLILGGNEEMGGWAYGFSSNSRRTQLYAGDRYSLQEGAVMQDARSRHTAILLADGLVWVAGGIGIVEVPVPSSEFYDPASKQFRIGPDFSRGRSEQSATLLRDGRVLVLGGVAHDAEPAELFVPELKPAPLEIFTVAEQGAVLHAGTGRLVSAEDPAAAGDVIEIYGRGISVGKLGPKVSVGGRLARVSYFGPSPGSEGVQQLNVEVPQGTRSGDSVEVWVLDGERPSNVVRIGVK